MRIIQTKSRILAYAAVSAVWLLAGTVGIWIGLNIGRAAFP